MGSFKQSFKTLSDTFSAQIASFITNGKLTELEEYQDDFTEFVIDITNMLNSIPDSVQEYKTMMAEQEEVMRAIKSQEEALKSLQASMQAKFGIPPTPQVQTRKSTTPIVPPITVRHSAPVQEMVATPQASSVVNQTPVYNTPVYNIPAPEPTYTPEPAPQPSYMPEPVYTPEPTPQVSYTPEPTYTPDPDPIPRMEEPEIDGAGLDDDLLSVMINSSEDSGEEDVSDIFDFAQDVLGNEDEEDSDISDSPIDRETSLSDLFDLDGADDYLDSDDEDFEDDAPQTSQEQVDELNRMQRLLQF